MLFAKALPAISEDWFVKIESQSGSNLVLLTFYPILQFRCRSGECLLSQPVLRRRSVWQSSQNRLMGRALMIMLMASGLETGYDSIASVVPHGPHPISITCSHRIKRCGGLCVRQMHRIGISTG